MKFKKMTSRRSVLRWARVLPLWIFALTTLTLAWAGDSGEPWRTKPYEQWDRNDVQQILNNSPWAKFEPINEDWKVRQPMNGPPGPSMPNQQRTTEGANPESDAPRPYDPQAPADGRQGIVYFGPFIVRWTSSRTVREALVRELILSGKMKEADAPKDLSAPITDYEIVVVGPNMIPFRGVSGDELKGKAYLRGKKSKVKVGATSVQIDRSPDGHEVTAVMFSFPRKTADGKDVAAPDEKGLQFGCNIKDLDLNTTFDPRKMADRKGPDF